MTTLLLTHPSFVGHNMGEGHPERPERMRAVDKALSGDAFGALVRRDAPIRDDAKTHILKAHPDAYYETLHTHAPGPGALNVQIDADTAMSPGSWEAASRAVGAGLEAVDAVFAETREIKNVFCQVRPPGHHAEKQRAMGFCLFSSIAIAALYARDVHGAERVAVVDFDVHHGNGTQDVFWSEPGMMFASTHQMPLYPGSGAVGETGAKDNICNAPLNPGDGGAQFADAFRSRILPAVKAFAPDLIMISAGFDAHESDPLANLRLREADFRWATDKLVALADTHCDGRLVSMLEGGYHLDALGRSAATHVAGLMDA
ncbi:MAG: histone deacetylase family protein [Pseudomonadota bacterium]